MTNKTLFAFVTAFLSGSFRTTGGQRGSDCPYTRRHRRNRAAGNDSGYCESSTSHG